MQSTYNAFPVRRAHPVPPAAKAIRYTDTITSHTITSHTITSHYLPWRAVYLVGPGTEVPQPIAASE